MSKASPDPKTNTETDPITGSAILRPPADYERRLALVVHRPSGIEMRLLVSGVPLTVGRAAPSDLCIDDRRLSREHARLLLVEGRILLEDLASTNGTWFAGRRIDKIDLEIGDEFNLGGLPARIHALGPAGESLRIDGDERFRRALDDEAVRAHQFHRSFALLVVSALRAGPRSAARDPNAHMHLWVERVRAELRPVDRIAPYGPDALQILLPEGGQEDALRIARKITSAPSERGPELIAGAALYPSSAATVEELLERARAALSRASAEHPVELAQTRAWRESEASESDGMVVGAAMRELLEMARRVAASRVPVIVQGETGTGKELLARFLHDKSPRREQRIVSVNCGAIPRDLVEGTLFGHERGAFTGATQQQKGVFEEANGGTIFLDEIGELPLAAQAALLRVLETGTLCRVGSSREISVDLRVLAATHRDLEAMIENGVFREDLYYRLNTITLRIPPLRDRVDEIESLASHFLRLANEANERSVQGIEPEALALLKVYSWPGNLRELRNAIERAVVITRGTSISVGDLPARVQATLGEPRRRTVSSPAPPKGGTAGVRVELQQHEARLLRDALEAADWNRNEVAEQLGIPVRTLSYRMKVLGLKKPED